MLRSCCLPGILFLGLQVTGCVSQAPDQPVKLEAGRIELTSTPFHPQTEYQCGPAALATVLESSGLGISPNQLAKEVYLPARKGTLQLEIIAAVRRHGRVPYEPDDSLQSLLDQLDEALPVLVLLNQGIAMFPAWHYAIVIGYQPETGSVILRSGTDYRLEMPRQRFEKEWKKAGNWSLVVLQPGQLPARVDFERYLAALIAIEEIGQWEVVEAGYRAVLTHSSDKSPVYSLALFGLANALRSDMQLDAAVQEYKKLLSLDAGHLPARNNLADTLLALGRCREAIDAINSISLNPDVEPSIRSVVHATRAEIYSACEVVSP